MRYSYLNKKKNIKFKHIQNSKLMFTHCLEYTIIKISLKDSQNLFLISIYSTHKNEWAFIKELDNIFGTLNLENNDNLYYIAGDLNAKHTSWSNSIDNYRGTKLNSWVYDNEFNIILNYITRKFHHFPNLCLI